ncbi:PefC/AfrB family outer membrane usher protein [Yersinia enterocolitica]|uniref:PefC/AfrB family outer membrane usher protein n=1 Tax=Yersinia enterocolitica TaxID=630 RepID=UPI0029B8B711|nr:PefC/AfrB family outer membrane usher protein [Yersinia enterocolitica]HEI6777225.1 PefC/AfrB family outer membrane usher protein [Yersinia enterocolitica]HEI6781482.1 PefC/AfrB family outer membrane usher protein [Yersinia enterocolitica]HEI6785755.1 PefC/AfrB family outer membrane usher protein [Yersinia enterocolitica]HEI6840752.1 PefC/AfrB family outer membrane usher protein [Yersinia enterocolitica]
MLFRPRIFTLSALSLALFSHFSVASDEELNLDFIQGTSFIPSVLKSNSHYPAGQYYVDIIVNKENIGKAKLDITSEEDESNELCLSPEWLKEVGVPIRLDAYKSELNTSKQCYQLGKSPYTRIDFNYGTQNLIFSIPQSNLVSKTDPSRWDYGVNAARLKYSGNFAQTSGQKTSAFANADLIVNMGRWVLASNMSATKNTSGSSEFAARDITLSTAISQIQSDLILGKSQTRSELFNDFGFYGVSLRSNSNMTPWEYRGYAPVINGVANSTSRITITQNGYTVYSKVVPPGPYQLSDVRPIGNGDLEVTVEDASGHKTTTLYPITTLPTLLRPGELQYNVATGRRTSSSNLKDAFSSGENGVFWMGSLGYGLSSTTLNVASILHDKYKAGGVSVTQSMGVFGAFSVGGNMAHASYDNETEKHGYSVSAKYAKSFTDSTDLQLLAYRYQSRGYVEFANFDSSDRYINDRKARYEMQISQRLTDSANMSLSAWRENYWWLDGNATGGDVSFSSTIFGDVSMFLRGSYSKQPYLDKADYSTSISFNVPFTFGGVRHYSTTGMSYSRDSKMGMNAGVSANPTDRLSYGVNTSLSEKGDRSLSGNVSYGFDSIQTNVMLTQGRNDTSLSGGVSGTLLGTPASGILMTRETSDTMGIVRIPNVSGVRFNNSAPTNRKGYTVVNLSDYAVNRINVDMENVPDYLELKTTSYNVVPTSRAVVYREFGSEHVQRYILRVIGRDGKALDGGSARTEQGLDAGFIANNGVLLMNMLSTPKSVNVDFGNGGICHFSMSGIKANTNKVQEVHCE